MTTDFRALCAELTDDLEKWVEGYLISDPPDECTAESFERIDRARAALAKQPVSKPYTLPQPGEVGVSDWQPIDTAPKDGTEILASDYDAIEIVSWKSYETGSGWESRWGESLFCAWWQPLPDHPPLSLSAPQAGEVQP